MNKTRLKEAEKRFLMLYPGGFENPEILEIAKKHKPGKMTKMAQDSFGVEQFSNPIKIVESMGKVIGQSSMVSVFEKPKFRDLVKGLIQSEKERLSHGLREFLHGNQEFGFVLMTELLQEYKLAKWPLLTVCGVYYRPDVEVFIKPTTAKNVIEFFGLEGLKYSPKPTFEFYRAYREQINAMKAQVDASLQVDNAAFCGFLMMTMENAHNLNEPTV